MPSYGTLGTLQARLADEVLGGVTAQQALNAICDAIARYQDERFWFNEFRMELGGDSSLDGVATAGLQASILGMVFPQPSTAPGQEYYAPATASGAAWPFLQAVSRVSTMSALVSGNRYKLRARTPEWFDDTSLNPSWRAMPTDWTFVAGRVRVYPVPDQAYPVLFTGTALWPLPAQASDASPWLTTGEGEELTRVAAAAMLYRRVLRNPDMGAAMDEEEQRAAGLVRSKSDLRTAPAGIRPKSWF